MEHKEQTIQESRALPNARPSVGIPGVVEWLLDTGAHDYVFATSAPDLACLPRSS